MGEWIGVSDEEWGHGRPLGFVLTPGQAHDVQGFGPLFGMLGDRIEALLAYADAIRAELAAAGVEAGHPRQEQPPRANPA